MAALRIRVRARLRARWRGWAAIAVLAGVLGGLVAGAAAGAGRTAGSYERYLASINSADVYIDSPQFIPGATIPLERVAQLPQVAKAEQTFHFAVMSRSRAGAPIFPLGPHSVEYLTPSDGRAQDTIDRLKLLSGRLPDPARADEMVGDTRALDTLGVHVGDQVTMRLFTRHQLLTSPVIRLSADPRKAHWGPLVRVRVVGEAANARADVDGGQMHLGPAFFAAHGRRQLGAWVEELVVKLRRGNADLPAFRRSVETIAGKRPFDIYLPSVGHPKIQHSIDLQARALSLVTLLGGLAGLLIVVQALTRLVATEARDDPVLRALGMTRSQNVAFGAVRALIIAVPAAALTTIVAWALSPLTPIGWARQLEPDSGFAFDERVVVGAAVVVFSVVLIAGTLATVRRPSPGRASRAGLGALGGRLGATLSRPSMAAGVRMALGGPSGASAAPVRTTLAAAVVAVLVAVTALTFAASFRHLLDTPRLYGQTWDYEAFFGSDQKPADLRKLASDPGITALAVGNDSSVLIDGHETGARAVDNLKGRVEPTVTEGRAPRGPDEIMLAGKTMDAVGAHVGGFVTLSARGHSKRMRVVARGVLPSSKTNKLGYGAVFSFKTLKRLDPSVPGALDEFVLAPGAAGDAANRRLNFKFDLSLVIRPGEVGDFGRIDNMPLYIALVFIAAAAAALAHALASSVRRRRRHLAILKTLGFTRAQVGAAVAWHATTIMAVAALVGVPLGIGVGRFAWNAFATDLGVQPETVVPLVPALLVVPLAVLLANLVAVGPGWAAARVRPARVLRAE